MSLLSMGIKPRGSRAMRKWELVQKDSRRGVPLIELHCMARDYFYRRGRSGLAEWVLCIGQWDALLDRERARELLIEFGLLDDDGRAKEDGKDT